MMKTDEQAVEEPDNLRFLRRLVTCLTAVMICGLLVLIGLFGWRFSQPATAPLPARIALPPGETAQAVTYGSGWYGVVTKSDRFLVFDAATGALRQSIDIRSGPQASETTR